jgi:very-short-patch-repair endonuclease
MDCGSWKAGRAALRGKARELRRAATPAERMLWDMLHARRLDGLKFRRQHVLAPYILDFYCPERRLAVEADGAQHLTPEGQRDDANRTVFLKGAGIRVLRFGNQEILRNPRAVLAEIRRMAFSDEHPGPPPLAKLLIVYDRDFLAPSPFSQARSHGPEHARKWCR